MNPVLEFRSTAADLQARHGLLLTVQTRAPTLDPDRIEHARIDRRTPVAMVGQLSLLADPIATQPKVCRVCGYTGEWPGFAGARCPRCADLANPIKKAGTG